jgi:hypothetical protein
VRGLHDNEKIPDFMRGLNEEIVGWDFPFDVRKERSLVLPKTEFFVGIEHFSDFMMYCNALVMDIEVSKEDQMRAPEFTEKRKSLYERFLSKEEN